MEKSFLVLLPPLPILPPLLYFFSSFFLSPDRKFLSCISSFHHFYLNKIAISFFLFLCCSPSLFLLSSSLLVCTCLHARMRGRNFLPLSSSPHPLLSLHFSLSSALLLKGEEEITSFPPLPSLSLLSPFFYLPFFLACLMKKFPCM